MSDFNPAEVSADLNRMGEICGELSAIRERLMVALLADALPPDLPDPNPEPEPDPDIDPIPDSDTGTYKTYSLGGGRDIWINGFLWKPISNVTGRLEVYLPGVINAPDSGVQYRAVKVWVAAPDGSKIQDLKYVDSVYPIIPNFPRTRWRSPDRPGADFPAGCSVVVEGEDGYRLIWNIEDSALRNSGPGNPDIQVPIRAVVLWAPGVADPPPAPLPPPGTPPSLDPRLWVWREGSKADNLGASNAVVVATHGVTEGHDIRLISMNGDPVTSVSAMVLRARQAAAEGCVGVCIDLESYMLRAGRAHCEKLAGAIQEILPLWWAPKVYLDHMISSWGGDFNSNAAWLGRFGAGTVSWIYNVPEAARWMGFVNGYRSAGFNKPFVALGDFHVRGSAGAPTVPFTVPAIHELARQGISVGVFAPSTNRFDRLVQTTAQWSEAVKVYA